MLTMVYILVKRNIVHGNTQYLKKTFLLIGFDLQLYTKQVLLQEQIQEDVWEEKPVEVELVTNKSS